MLEDKGKGYSKGGGREEGCGMQWGGHITVQNGSA